MLTRDKDLKTEDEIQERIKLIRKNRDTENDRPTRDNHIDAFRAKHKRITKLTEREGKLLAKLNQLRKGN